MDCSKCKIYPSLICQKCYTEDIYEAEQRVLGVARKVLKDIPLHFGDLIDEIEQQLEGEG